MLVAVKITQGVSKPVSLVYDDPLWYPPTNDRAYTEYNMEAKKSSARSKAPKQIDSEKIILVSDQVDLVSDDEVKTKEDFSGIFEVYKKGVQKPAKG